MNEQLGRRARPTRLFRAFAAALGLAVVASLLPASAPRTAAAPAPPVASYVMCVPFFTTTSPSIDGSIANDLGWVNASRYMFESNTHVGYGIVQAVRDGGNLYLSFQVNQDTSYDQEDAILIGLGPGGAANDRRIVIFPMETNTAPSGTPPSLVWYATHSNTTTVNGVTTTTWTPGTQNPGWLVNNIRTSASGSSWFTEVKIPINNAAAAANPDNDTGVNLPNTGTFGLYFSLIRVVTSGASDGSESPWPHEAYLSGSAPNNIYYPDTNFPPPSAWGRGTLNATGCGGVHVGHDDIIIEHPTLPAGSPLDDPNNVVIGRQNIFTVTPRNDTIDPTGQYQPANQVSARFRWGYFGLPSYGDWTDVPQDSPGNGDTNPTVEKQIPAATSSNSPGTNTLKTGPYTPGQALNYCTTVELLSRAADTTFANTHAARNITWVNPNSPFNGRAVIGTKGYKLVPGANDHQIVLRSFTYNTKPTDKWAQTIEGAQAIGAEGYELHIKPEAQANLAMRITPPRIIVPNRSIRVPPGTGGTAHRPVAVPVVPSGLVTVFADGGVQLRRKQVGPFVGPVGPSGIGVTKEMVTGNLRLPERYAPRSRVGGLIGSWDNFAKTSFPIGTTTTLRAPATAKQLYLAINDSASGYLEQSGPGFGVEVVATPMQKEFTQADSATAFDWDKSVYKPSLAANLPSWVMCGQLITGKRVNLRGKIVRLNDDIGCFAYVIKKMRVAKPIPNKPIPKKPIPKKPIPR